LLRHLQKESNFKYVRINQVLSQRTYSENHIHEQVPFVQYYFSRLLLFTKKSR
jgi:hypothetical protein